ncbi:unnamed protein product [Lupinus luteus]|uniref:Uncharacterized protein n=1 Tax=Lupinus luteus TaxID=3873 RepID=A0AAV1XH39_LUPLU
MFSVAFNKGQNAGKAKKKQVKDELDRLKQAEKKKRRLEKALATSAAIISELEKKKEQQRRLDEEGAAIAEAVALHVLLGEDSEDSCKVVIDDNGRKTWNCNHNLDHFVAGKRACFPHLDGGTWSVTSENGKWSFSSGSFEKNLYDPLYEEAGWGTAGLSADLIAAQAARSLQIADDDRILF